MPFRKIQDSIPDFYHPFLPELFQHEIPPEPFADCHNCPMIDEKEELTGSDMAKPFSPATKCCTYTPRIPNYMVGAILADSEKSMFSGIKRIQERIKSREGIIPNGVYPTKKYHDYYMENAEKEFGNSKSLRCPYYIHDKYNCTIWKYREAICSFWFCKHLASDTGADFWKSMIKYFKTIQESFLVVATQDSGLFPVDLYGDNSYYQLHVNENPTVRKKEYSKIWGKWEGREEQFYIRCYEVVINLSAHQQKNLFSDGEKLERELETKLHELEFIPDLLIADKNTIEAINGNSYQIEVNSFIRPINKTIAWSFQLPKYVMDYFDGKNRTNQIIKKLQENYNTTLDPEIIIALYRHNILKDTTPPN